MQGRREGARRSSWRRSTVLVLAAALLISAPGAVTPEAAAALTSAPVKAHGDEAPPTENPGTDDPGTDDPGTDPDLPDDGGDETPQPGDENGTPDPEEPAEQPGDESPEAPIDYASAEHRGADGGIASFSPGPENAKPWNGSEEPPTARAMAAGRGAVLGNDYPAKYRNLPWPYPAGAYIWDEWNFAYRQCTSFVAWRLRSANKIPFSNQYLGLYAWGDAGQWAASARAAAKVDPTIRVDTTPEVGAVAWSGPGYGDASSFGHVAWVAQVLSNGNIVIEEYNFGWAGAYNTRTVHPSAFQGYIHLKDLTAPFAKTTKPSIGGAPMVGGTLTASVAAWSPAATTVRYRWLRDGKVISGATAKTYQPTVADLGKKITVETTGMRAGYAATSTTSAATAAVTMTDADGDGIGDAQQTAPLNSDVNGDGLPDAVGFSNGGVQVALATKTGLGAPKQWIADFGKTKGWNAQTHPRTLTDVNGDGKADVVGFGDNGVMVALSTGSGFATAKNWLSNFGAVAGWQSDRHPRTLADVNGDGIADVVGFGDNGVMVALGTGSGFAAAKQWRAGFGAGDGWRVDRHPRFLADMNGDGRDDVVGFANAGMQVALSTGTGFAAPKLWAADLGYSQGWRSESHQRTLADVNGDGLPDAIGFGAEGVYAGLNTGSGLGAVKRWRSEFGLSDGWKVGQHPRILADVNGDGKADVVGFASARTVVSLSTGSSFGAASTWTSEFAGSSWRADQQPRVVTDANGDGRADVIGFADDGVRIALSTGRAFSGSKLALAQMGRSAGGWSVASHPRLVGIRTLASPPTPAVSGTARVGEQLKASVGTWQPRPVTTSVQWLRDGKAISGATKTAYTTTPDDLGAQITVRATGAKFGHAQASRSSKAQKVAEGVLKPATPTISGTGKPGAELEAVTKAWGPVTVDLRYQWNRNGSPIKGATGKSYKVAAGDATRRISVTVTGTARGYRSEDRTSASTRVIGKAPTTPKTSPFVDVTTKNRFYKHIAWMHGTGLAVGSKTSRGVEYGPERPVTRGAMAAFIYRLDAVKSYRGPAKQAFVDVPAGYTFYKPIGWMHEQGLAVGASSARGTVYSPEAPVTRGAMAAFIARLEAPGDYRPPAKSPFVDVPTNHKFYRVIAWMHEAGIAAGVQTSRGVEYRPDEPVTRGAMAAFIYRMETRPAS